MRCVVDGVVGVVVVIVDVVGRVVGFVAVVGVVGVVVVAVGIQSGPWESQGPTSRSGAPKWGPESMRVQGTSKLAKS